MNNVHNRLHFLTTLTLSGRTVSSPDYQLKDTHTSYFRLLPALLKTLTLEFVTIMDNW